jgi:hypothetical protein
MKARTVLAALVCLACGLGPARAQFVNPACRDTVLRRPSRIDAVLGGRIVHPPVLRRCVGGETTLVTFSAVHLIEPGLCEFARYNARRDGTVWRRDADGGAQGGRCPGQGHSSYTSTTGVSRDEFLALSRFWRALRTGGTIPAESIVAHLQERALAVTMRRHLVAVRRLLPQMSDRLRIMESNPDLSMMRIRLSPAEKRMRKFKITAGLGLSLYLVGANGGFEIVGDYLPIE